MSTSSSESKDETQDNTNHENRSHWNSSKVEDFHNLTALQSTVWPLPSPLQSTPLHLNHLGWSPLFDDIDPGKADAAHDQDHPHCDCFATALQRIKELHHYAQGPESFAIDSRMRTAREGVHSCNAFLACHSCSEQGDVLLYLAIIQQAILCYGSLMGVSFGNLSQEVYLRVGTFEVKVEASAKLAQTMFAIELEHAADCVATFSTRLEKRAYVDEIRFQQDLLRSFRASLDKLRFSESKEQ